MTDLPRGSVARPGVGTTITPASWSSIGAGFAMSAGSFASAALGTANLAIYVPFVVEYPVTVTQLGWMNGATVNGNTDVGIYDVGGNRKVSTGSTVQATINVCQFVDVTDTPLAPGDYWMALATSSATATFMRWAVSIPQGRVLGCQQQATAFALPATWTAATFATAFIPIIIVALVPTV